MNLYKLHQWNRSSTQRGSLTVEIEDLGRGVHKPSLLVELTATWIELGQSECKLIASAKDLIWKTPSTLHLEFEALCPFRPALQMALSTVSITSCMIVAHWN